MKPWRVAVLGGGITGLAAAHALVKNESDLEMTLFEASSRVGGVIETLQLDSLIVELGPDMFTTRDPEALQLCRELGIAEQLIGTETKRRGAFIVKHGRLHRVPEGMALMAPQRLRAIWQTPLLSWRGRLRLIGESLIPPKTSDNDETLESFACRRFGKEAYQWLIQPLISGIYTADPKKLSMQATMGEFLEMERAAGSIIRATLRKKRDKQRGLANTPDDSADSTGARYGLFLAPRTGMETITRALADAIGHQRIRLNAPVRRMQQNQHEKRWTLNFDRGREAEEFDAVVIATRAPVAGQIIQDVSQELADQLRAIPYASTAVAVLVVPRDRISHPLDSFGMVVPLAEHREIIAASFANHKFSGRAPEDRVIIRVFIGGACQPELLQRSDSELLELATRELTELIGLDAKAPLDRSQVVRWNHAMPQYHVGHRERVAKIETLVSQLDRCELAGNAYHGVGIPACIASGQQAAMRVLNELQARKGVRTQ